MWPVSRRRRGFVITAFDSADLSRHMAAFRAVYLVAYFARGPLGQARKLLWGPITLSGIAGAAPARVSLGKLATTSRTVAYAGGAARGLSSAT